MDSRSLYPRLGFSNFESGHAELVRSRAIRMFPAVPVAIHISAMGTTSPDLVPGDIVARIVSVRGQRLLFDFDLAAIYGVTTARLNQQVNRNLERFPADFIFRLEDQELTTLMLQFATSKQRVERHSIRAVQMSVYVVRAFVKLRETLASNSDLARRLETLERSVAALDADSRKQFDHVYGAIPGLMGSGPRRN